MLPRAHCGDQETEVREDSFQVSEIPRLVIRNHNGSVTVKSSIDLRTVDVIATLSNPNRVDYRADQMGNTVVITVNVKNGFRLFGKSGGANIEVAVPEIIDLDLESDNGKVTAENITGLVSAETSNGRITLDGITGSASARTSNGKIEISRFRGELEAQTSNGAIDFEGALSPGSDNRLSISNGGVVCGGLPTFQEVGHEHLNVLPPGCQGHPGAFPGRSSSCGIV